jgi:hypothetical protein
VCILQEFVLSRELIVVCENKTIEWSVLDSAFMSWSEDLVGRYDPKEVYINFTTRMIE